MKVLAPLVVLACLVLVPSAVAQRRARTSGPVAAQLSAEGGPHRLRLHVVALSDVTLTADPRLLHLEVRAPGARRALPCDSPTRPRRLDPSTTVSLRAEESWDATFDVRTLCWGRALTALEAGAELSGTYGLARGRAGVPIARTDAGEVRSAPLPVLAVAAVPAPEAPTGDVRVTLAPADAVSGAHVSLRVLVRAVRAVRGWVRPDHVRFRVRAPDGTTSTCSMPRGGGAPIPDLFARMSPRSGPSLSLDARAYCDASTFEAAGIYEVTPILDLDVSGAEWHLDTPLGHFEGAPAPVRIRTATSGGRS